MLSLNLDALAGLGRLIMLLDLSYCWGSVSYFELLLGERGFMFGVGFYVWGFELVGSLVIVGRACGFILCLVFNICRGNERPE